MKNEFMCTIKLGTVYCIISVIERKQQINLRSRTTLLKQYTSGKSTQIISDKYYTVNIKILLYIYI